MKRYLHVAPMTLIELIVYMGLLAVIGTLAAPLLSEGFQLSETTTDITRSSHSAQLILDRIRRDIRCASDIETDSVTLASGPIPLYVTLNDETRVAYTIQNNSLIRIDIPEDSELHGNTKPPDEWSELVAAGNFTRLDATPVTNAERVYRLKLTAQIKRGNAYDDFEEAQFVTAAQIRREQSP